MMNSWTNEDGEPIMDGAAWRFEAQLDAEYQPDPYDDYDDYGDDYECDDCGGDCDGGCTVEVESDPIEDSWLDGSYEE